MSAADTRSTTTPLEATPNCTFVTTAQAVTSSDPTPTRRALLRAPTSVLPTLENTLGSVVSTYQFDILVIS